MDEHEKEYPSKRMRLTHREEGAETAKRNLHMMQEDTVYTTKEMNSDRSWNESKDSDLETISISSTSKQASQAIAPFLSKHIPHQYAPRGQPDTAAPDPSTKYCYRHRPDLKCRRQANEPSMDQLQRVRRKPNCVFKGANNPAGARNSLPE